MYTLAFFQSKVFLWLHERILTTEQCTPCSCLQLKWRKAALLVWLTVPQEWQKKCCSGRLILLNECGGDTDVWVSHRDQKQWVSRQGIGRDRIKMHWNLWRWWKKKETKILKMNRSVIFLKKKQPPQCAGRKGGLFMSGCCHTPLAIVTAVDERNWFAKV